MISHRRIDGLIAKGVNIPVPETIEIGLEVDLGRISGDGVTLHAGCKLFGANTLICSGSVLGREAPVTVDNCQIGPGVQLKGGYFKEAVFLSKAEMGSGAHVREGTILEEEAGGAHSVGLKQTILFPYVTLGSLINFCDCLMAGGTDREHHSEVGSSYIHFNYTPHQDKATASLIGDVPQGVMLNQPPIFLGGQGGLVGPCRITYGTVIAAGSICRKDELRPGRLLIDGVSRGESIPFIGGMYQSVRRVVQNNILYIANLIALRCWYQTVRRLFVSDQFPEALLRGLLEKVDMGIYERMKRLKELSLKMPESIRMYREQVGKNASISLLDQKEQLYGRWPELEALLILKKDQTIDLKENDSFLQALEKGIQNYGKDYISVIKHLSGADAETGADWLQQIVDDISNEAYSLLPSFKFLSS